MGARYDFVVTTKVDVVASEEAAEKLCEELTKEFANSDVDIDEKEEGYVITLKEAGRGEYFQGCRYTSNGDGYPDEWEEEYDIVSEYVEEVIEKFISEHTEYEFDDWMVHEESVDRG